MVRLRKLRRTQNSFHLPDEDEENTPLRETRMKKAVRKSCPSDTSESPDEDPVPKRTLRKRKGKKKAYTLPPLSKAIESIINSEKRNQQKKSTSNNSEGESKENSPIIPPMSLSTTSCTPPKMNLRKQRRTWLKVIDEPASNYSDMSSTSTAEISTSKTQRRRRKRWSSEIKRGSLTRPVDLTETHRSDHNSDNSSIHKTVARRQSRSLSKNVDNENSDSNSDAGTFVGAADNGLDSSSVGKVPRKSRSLTKNVDKLDEFNKSTRNSVAGKFVKAANNDSDSSTDEEVPEVVTCLDGLTEKPFSSNHVDFPAGSNVMKRRSVSMGDILKTPGSISRRRETYELEESVFEPSVLQLLSETKSQDTVIVVSDDSPILAVHDTKNVTLRRKKTTLNANVAVIGHPTEVLQLSTFSKPPLYVSTPYVVKHDLPKKAIIQNAANRVALLKRRSRSAGATTKLPNFAKIHQKAADRLENLPQMVQRKKERALLLLSGQRPDPPKLDQKEQKKTSKRLIFDNSQPSTSNQQAQSSRTREVNVATTTATSGAIPKKITKKMDAVKALVGKQKPKTNYKDENRELLKGVRSNRRFELMMKMRK